MPSSSQIAVIKANIANEALPSPGSGDLLTISYQTGGVPCPSAFPSHLNPCQRKPDFWLSAGIEGTALKESIRNQYGQTDRLSGIDFLLFRINNLTKSIVLSKLLIISKLIRLQILIPDRLRK